MRNATEQDIKDLQNGREMPYNVMFFLRNLKKKVHRVCHHNPNTLAHPDVWCLVEDADGKVIYTTNPKHELSHIEVGPATTPRKERRKPTKGSKPVKEIPYDSAKIAVGMKVRCHDGKTRIVTKIDVEDDGIFFDGRDYADIWLCSGTVWKDKRHTSQYDIVGMFVAKEPPVAAKENDWIFWDGTKKNPNLPAGTKVNVWLRRYTRDMNNVFDWSFYDWTWGNTNADNQIIAYKVVE